MPKDLLADGNVKATWVTAIADISNPTVAELTAGVDLEWFITKDGLDLKSDNAAVDNTALASTEETSDVGLATHDNSVTFKRKDQDVDDVAYNTLVEKAAGFLVVRRTLAVSTGYAVGQEVEVYPSRCGRPSPQPPAKNTAQTVMVKLFTYAPADNRATVAA
jgi:hypothetical protein